MASGAAGPRRIRAGDAAGNALLRAALDNTRPGLLVFDRDMNVALLTRAAARMLGLPEDSGARVPAMQLLGQSRTIDASTLQSLQAMFGDCRGSAEPRDILLALTDGGQARLIALELRPAEGQGYVGCLEDVTERRATESWLLEHASTDPLTGLCNRQYFRLLLADRLSAGEGATVILININRFKSINDHLGQTIGDQLLRQVAERLAGVVRESDGLARLSGDEFAILMSPALPTAALQSLAERIIDLLARSYTVEGQAIDVAASVGIASGPEDGGTPEDLMKNAALALGAARSPDRLSGAFGWRFYEPSLEEQVRARRSLELDLRLALGRSEFELHYQPQVNVASGSIVGFEALIRWRSPSRGLVPPNDFIPLAEEIGQIVPIGEWVMREACRQASAWPEDVAVAVNASPLQFEAPGFADMVADALRQSGLRGDRLEVEVTESLLLHPNAAVMATLDTLRRMGVRLVLDDFGTGFASLSQLGRFSFDKIKIDRSFVSGSHWVREHGAIVRAVAALGISLGIPTTAEGVETGVQLERMRADGCTCVQGYYYSKPVPAEGVAMLLQTLHRPCVAA